jgi:hypothetical protein
MKGCAVLGLAVNTLFEVTWKYVPSKGKAPLKELYTGRSSTTANLGPQQLLQPLELALPLTFLQLSLPQPTPRVLQLLLQLQLVLQQLQPPMLPALLLLQLLHEP